METTQFNQIEKSFNTAIKVRPEMIRYIVCIPRDFTSKKVVKNGEIVKAFEKSINGWAKTKYIPDLYSTGYIHDKLEIFTGNYSIVKKRCDKVKSVQYVLERLEKNVRTTKYME